MPDSSKTSSDHSEREAFDALLRRLHPDRDRAGELYEDLRRKLMKMFQIHGCSTFDELADETVRRVMRKIAEGYEIEAENPSVFFHGVARNVLREYWKSREREVDRLEDVPVWKRPAERPGQTAERELERLERENRLECLEKCLSALPPENRDLFVEYHRGELRERIDNRDRMARSLGIPVEALRLRIHRLREKLQACITKCLKTK